MPKRRKRAKEEVDFRKASSISTYTYLVLSVPASFHTHNSSSTTLSVLSNLLRSEERGCASLARPNWPSRAHRKAMRALESCLRSPTFHKSPSDWTCSDFVTRPGTYIPHLAKKKSREKILQAIREQVCSHYCTYWKKAATVQGGGDRRSVRSR